MFNMDVKLKLMSLAAEACGAAAATQAFGAAAAAEMVTGMYKALAAELAASVNREACPDYPYTEPMDEISRSIAMERLRSAELRRSIRFAHSEGLLLQLLKDAGVVSGLNPLQFQNPQQS